MSTELAPLEARLNEQRLRLQRACVLAKRDPTSVRLLAVSKRQPASCIAAAYELGQRDFGENYAQELAQKAAELAQLSEIRWHMIGHLQSNKAKLVAPFVHTVASVDSIKLARELAKQVDSQRPPERGPLNVLLEVNIGSEEQKAGAPPEAVPELIEAIQQEPRLSLRGLLCIPPDAENAEASRPYFRRLVELRESWGGAAILPELSMGMSRDLEVAIQEGATWVRIGTAIFGERAG